MALTAPRQLLVLAHRYIGLVLAAFLLLAGLTGAVLAWYHELDAMVNPQLRIAQPAGAQPLHGLVLRERVLERYPDARVDMVPLAQHGEEPAVFFLQNGGGNDQVFVDPYTGAIVLERRWGDLSQGATNLLPFIYRLHYQLALGTVGTVTFGVIALVWTLDCFIAFLLTLPVRLRAAGPGGGWWLRWCRAWQVRTGGSAWQLNFDLHRAGGLWLWAWMFVFAWSSVALNLHDVYDPVMHTLFESQESAPAAAPRPTPADAPAMGWEAGLARGQALMAQLARQHGFTVLNDQRIAYRARAGVFQFRAHTDRDLRARRGVTSVDFDAATGAYLRSHVPTGVAAGDTITAWLIVLHVADVRGWGAPFQWLVVVLGLATAMLSVTGVWIWWKKRRARRMSRSSAAVAR